MREIVLDTETTGLDPTSGDRLVEIGCVELIERMPTGKTFHKFINPERDVPNEAYEIHGLSTEFLSDKPKFPEIADEFLKYIGDAKLVIHNAEFDMKFINHELDSINKNLVIPNDRVIDTLRLARDKHPAGSNSLDALCSRYNIDNSKRVKHGALLDAELLSEVYIELTGGKQSKLNLESSPEESSLERKAEESGISNSPVQKRPAPLPSRLTEADIAAHAEFVKGMGENAVWTKYA